MSLRGSAPVVLLFSFDFENFSFCDLWIICVCAFLQIITCFFIIFVLFSIWDLFRDVLCLFVAMFSFSVNLFRSSDVFYVLMSLLMLCVL